MQQSHALIDLLKKLIREHGKTYKDIAKAIDMSEASIKRLFSEKTFSMARFEEVCSALNIDLIEVVHLLEERTKKTEQLTVAQERELVSQQDLLLVAVLVLSNWSFTDIHAEYKFTEPKLVKLFAQLDRMKIIELQPGNRVRLLIAPSFDWIPDGPIQQFFEKHVQSDFFASRFAKPNELRLFVNGMLSPASHQDITQKMRRLIQEFHHCLEKDRKLPLEEKWGTGLVVAMRPWRLPVFEKLRRSTSS